MVSKSSLQNISASAMILLMTSACSDGSNFFVDSAAEADANAAALGAESPDTNPEPNTPSVGAANPDTAIDANTSDLGATTPESGTDNESTPDLGSNDEIRAQAIDGYIVGGTVFCDGIISGFTQAAGQLTCPSGTEIINVRGGVDVGFNETATTGDTLFVGELSAPGHLGYITPLSTVAVEMASDTDGYDDAKWNESVQNLGTTLGQSSLDLSVNAATDIGLARLNAQINQVVSEFSQTHDDYELVIESLAEAITQNANAGAFTDFESGVSNTMIAVNERLAESNAELALSQSELEVSALTVQMANTAIAESESPASVATTATQSIVEQAAVTIDRVNASVGINEYYFHTGNNISLNDFEYPVISSGKYYTVVNSRVRSISYDNRVLQFNESFDEARVSMAFEIKVLDTDNDLRSLSFATDDVSLSAIKNDASSLVLTMPVDAIFNVHGTKKNGTATTTQIMAETADTFSSVGGRLNVTFAKINAKLVELGFTDILETSGNYQMTMVISGLHINERSGSSIQPAEYYTVGTGSTRLTGAGFQGYLTVDR